MGSKRRRAPQVRGADSATGTTSLSNPDRVQSLKNKLGGFRWVAYSVVLVLVVNGAATFTDSIRKLGVFWRDARATIVGQQLTDSQLREAALATARAVMEFGSTRQASEPQIDFDNFQVSTQLQMRHTRDTQDEYVARFAGRVAMLRDEFLKRGNSHPDLDLHFQYPTNHLGLRSVARGLGTLGEQLPHTEREPPQTER